MLYLCLRVEQDQAQIIFPTYALYVNNTAECVISIFFLLNKSEN